MEKTNEKKTISYTQDDLSRLTKKREYRDGWYCLMCVGVKTGTNSTGSFFVEPEYRPLGDPRDETSKGSRSVYDRLALPIKNPEKEHKIPDNLNVIHSRLKAHGDKIVEGIPSFPRKEDGVFVFDGEEITGTREEVKRALDAANVTVKEAQLKNIVAVYNDPSPLVGTIVYGKLRTEGDRKRVAVVLRELPSDAELVPEAEWFGV